MTMTDYLNTVVEKLPFGEPFLFVDGLTHLDEDSVRGFFTFQADLAFYRGHFRGHPVTPGVLLTECCAQIGLVCLGIHLLGRQHQQREGGYVLALAESSMEFLHPVYPGERVEVTGEKVFFRFGKLKVKVSLTRADGQMACRGELAGMLKPEEP
jgi:3-hydroxyacyl-[acyl-carrier-protein] dehydratase